MNERQKIQSSYPELQALLPQLALLGSSAWRPVIKEREEAEDLIAKAKRKEDLDLKLAPVWRIDHGDLQESKIVGWSMLEDVN